MDVIIGNFLDFFRGKIHSIQNMKVGIIDLRRGQYPVIRIVRSKN